MPQPTQYALVYDVGGSHVSAAVCAQFTSALQGLTRAPLPASPSESTSKSQSSGGHFSAASFVRLIHALGEAAAKSANLPLTSIAGACLAMPGPFDYQAGISHMQHKLYSLYNFDLKSALADHFHWQPEQIRFLNDASAFTLGEAGAGAAKGYPRVLGLTLGTGIGAGFAIDNRIADSSPGNAERIPAGGELWNLPYNGATVEDFVSTRYLRGHYQALTGLEEQVTTIADTAQGDHPCPEIPALQSPSVPLLDSYDPNAPYAAHCRARQTFQDFGHHLGMVLNRHAAAFHPDVIVIGGGIARASALFLPYTRKALAFKTQIVISSLMDEAPLAGAGFHWFSASS